MNDNNNYNTTIDDMVQLLILEKEKVKRYFFLFTFNLVAPQQ